MLCFLKKHQSPALVSHRFTPCSILQWDTDCVELTSPASILHWPLFYCAAVPALWGQCTHRPWNACFENFTQLFALVLTWSSAGFEFRPQEAQKVQSHGKTASSTHGWVLSALDQSCNKLWLSSSLSILAHALRKYHFQSTLSKQIEHAPAQKSNLEMRCSDASGCQMICFFRNTFCTLQLKASPCIGEVDNNFWLFSMPKIIPECCKSLFSTNSL